MLELALGGGLPPQETPATALLGAFTRFAGCPHALVSLGPDSMAWCAGESGGVSYVRRGAFCLAAGDPIAAPADHVRIANEFAAFAATRGRHAVFLPATESFALRMRTAGWTCLKLGASPYFDLQVWNPKGNAARHLRSSVNRAIKAGVTVAQTTDVGALRVALQRLCADWLQTRPAGTSFGWLFALQPLQNAQYKRFFVARDQHGAIVGLLAASAMPLREGWYLEDVVRAPGSPQGVCDVLVYQALRMLQADGYKSATLGTVPLADDGEDLTPAGEWLATRRNLKIAKRLLGGFYNCNGLHSFKAKFVPTRWEAEYAVLPESGGALFPIRIALAALRAIMPDGLWPMLRHVLARRRASSAAQAVVR